MAIYRKNLIPCLQAGGLDFGIVPHKVIDHLAGHRFAAACQNQKDHKAQRKIHQCAGGNHEKALPGAGLMEPPAVHPGRQQRCGAVISGRFRLAAGRGFLLRLLGLLPFHGVIAAQREQPDAVPGAVFLPAPKRRAESDGELLHPDAAPPRREKMAQFMDENDRTKHQNGHNCGEQSCHKHLENQLGLRWNTRESQICALTYSRAMRSHA